MSVDVTRCRFKTHQILISSYQFFLFLYFFLFRSKEYIPLSPPLDGILSPASGGEAPSKPDALPHLDMDLMGDLQEVINRQCSLLDRTEAPSPPILRAVSTTYWLIVIFPQQLLSCLPDFVGSSTYLINIYHKCSQRLCHPQGDLGQCCPLCCTGSRSPLSLARLILRSR